MVAKSCLILLLTGCAATCEQYGVRELGQSLGPVIEAREVYASELESLCGVLKAGCVKPEAAGVRVYWRYDDHCAKAHEYCHVDHGLYHTVRYMQDVIADHPLPYCPE